jgi:hypothetical protein
MLTNGASGNTNNVDVAGSTSGASATEQAQRVATAVAAAAIVATAMEPRVESIQLGARTTPVAVKRREIANADILLAKQILVGQENRDPAGRFSFEVGRQIPGPQRETYAREVLDVAAMPNDYLVEIQVIRIGDLQLVAAPGEMFVELGLAIKQSVSPGHATIVGLANDYIGYLPTLEAFDQGGYETWAARSAWPAPGTGEALIQMAIAMLD